MLFMSVYYCLIVYAMIGESAPAAFVASLPPWIAWRLPGVSSIIV
jgi:hypothetical protein